MRSRAGPYLLVVLADLFFVAERDLFLGCDFPAAFVTKSRMYVCTTTYNISNICWLQNREIYITGTAPYSTGTGYSTSTVRLQSWYCPTFFFRSIVFHFSDGLGYLHTFDVP